MRTMNVTSRPVAYVAVQDRSTRTEISDRLERSGWAVSAQPSGFHLLQSIADVIDGHERSRDPMLIVVDAYPPGCSGTTIAAGLRDLGITIPIVLLRKPGDPVPVTDDETLRIVDAGHAPAVVAELANRRSHPARDRPPPQVGIGRTFTGTCL